MSFDPHALTPAELLLVVAQERPGKPFLAYRDGSGELCLHALGDSSRVTIGRHPDSDLVLAWDEEVSRAHAVLERIGGEWAIEDDRLSRNGSFVNGSRIGGRRRLGDRDVVRLGHVELLFRVPGAEGDKTATARDRASLARLSNAQRRVLVALCRPLAAGRVGAPAGNRQIADELGVSVDAVKTQMRSLFTSLEVEDLPQNRKRAELARRAIELGFVSTAELLDNDR
jgi:pSer/pThr/pTyr-binding forkhead associated (FHA) protein